MAVPDFRTSVKDIVDVRQALQRIRLRLNTAPLHNFTATTDPTANDDSGDGYSIGSFWVNTSTSEAFLCTDATEGVAVWENITDAGLGGGAVDGFSTITDGTTPANASGADTFKLRSANNILSIATQDDDVTHGDNALFTINQANIDHDALTNFVGNEHVDHSSVSIIAGTALTGGGDLTASRTLNVDETAIDHDNLLNFVADEHIAHSSVNLTAGEGLTGGGTIDANRSFDLDINGLTADGSPVGSTDYVVTYDADAGTHKKVLLDDLPGGGGGDTHPVVDTTELVKGSVDDTKKIRIEVDGLTTATTRVLTFPDRNIGDSELRTHTAAAADNRIIRSDGTSGDIQGGPASLDDGGVLSGISDIIATGTIDANVLDADKVEINDTGGSNHRRFTNSSGKILATNTSDVEGRYISKDSIERIGTTKGDLTVDDGSDPQRLGVGTDGQVLTADSAETLGVKWADAGGGGGLSDAYSTITDGTTPANASGGDTFKLRSANAILSIATQDNDATHGDNALFTVDESQIDHDALTNFVAAEHRTHPTSTDNALARFDGTSGDLQDSGVTLDDSDVMSGVTQLNVDDLRLDGAEISTTTFGQDLTIQAATSASIILNTGGGSDIIDLQVNSSSRLEVGNTILAKSTVDVTGEVVAHREDSGTNTKLDLLTLRRTTTGTAAQDLGLNILLELRDDSGNDDVAGKIVCDWSTATHLSEASVLEFHTMRAGTLEEALLIDSNGMLLRRARSLQVYDSANSNYVQVSHDGTDGSVLEVTGGSLLLGGGGASQLLELDPNGGVSSRPRATVTGGFHVNAGNDTIAFDGGDFAVDSDTLFVDDATHRVGIGLTTPDVQLHIASDGGSDRGLRVQQSDDSTAASNIGFLRSRGTIAAPTVPNNGDTLGVFAMRSWDGSGGWTQQARFGFTADGATSAITNVVPTAFFIETGEDGGSRTERMRITSGGLVRITSDAVLQIADGISAPATASGWASIYVDTSDGDLKVKFGDGTVKTIVTDT